MCPLHRQQEPQGSAAWRLSWRSRGLYVRFSEQHRYVDRRNDRHAQSTDITKPLSIVCFSDNGILVKFILC